VVALDEVGRNVGQKTVSTDGEGHLQLLRWVRRFEEVEFALEDCRHLTRRLEGAVLDRELDTLMKDLAPTLLTVPGCGVLSAAVLVGVRMTS
jgi:hypothetical protein